MASRDPPKPSIDRQSTTPFHLKLFYRQHAFHHLADFPVASAPSRGGAHIGSNASSGMQLPAHLQIYTWQSCTLRELSQLLTSALPGQLPSPPIGTRLCFRLVYPDTRGAAAMGPDARGRYLSKDMGSVIVGDREGKQHDGNEKNSDGSARTYRLQGDDADKMLQDMRFVIGDFVDCAILPPLEDGSIAPAIVSGRGVGGAPIGGGMRAFRENGFGRGGRGGGGRMGERAGGGGIPSGDWRRGERLPDTRGRGGGGTGGGRRGWAPY